MNPYIVFSAVLGLGLRGIKNRIELTRPPISTKGLKDGSSASEVPSPSLPLSKAWRPFVD